MSKRREAWFGYATTDQIRFKPLWLVVGRLARVLQWLRHPELRARGRGPEWWEAVESFGAPVYGLVDGFMGLKLGPMGYGGDEIELGFKRGTLDGAGPLVLVQTRKKEPSTSAAAADEARFQPVLLSLRMAASARSAAGGDPVLWQRLFDEFSQREEEPSEDGGLPDLLQGRKLEVVGEIKPLTSGFPAAAPLHSVTEWNVLVVVLENEQTELIISSCGLTPAELEELTAHVAPVGEHPGLLDRYKSEFAARADEFTGEGTT